ncbi:MAG: hypothetical protein KAR42_16965 [candidate division Zixibacteria bacterium]|nr:hypothetical protein [candidate division Zixibacteria bacterium]
MFAKLICFFIGHSFFIIASKTTDRSTFGWLRCCRCPEEEQFQYDY